MMLTDDQILEILSSSDTQSKYTALEQLLKSQSSSREIIDALEKASHDDDMGVVVRAIKALQSPVHHRMALEMGLFGPVDAEILKSTAPAAPDERQPASPAQTIAETSHTTPGQLPSAGIEKQLDRSVSPTEAASILLSPPANVFRRGLALLIDLLILAVFTIAIGMLFDNLLQRIGFYSRFIISVIALLYFSLFNSRLMGSATPGKRIFKLQVVSSAGSPINLPKAILRSLIIVLLILFFGWQFPGRDANTVVLFIVSMITTGIIVAILYLAIFNRRSGQSLDDLLVDSRVVYNDGAGVEFYAPTSRLSKIITIAIVLILPAIIATEKQFSQNLTSGSASPDDLSQLVHTLQQDPRYYMTEVYTTNQVTTSDQPINLLVINLWPRSLLDAAGRQAAAHEAAQLVQEFVPESAYDGLQVRVVGGYDLGFFEKSIVWFCAPPAECSTELVRTTFLRILNFTGNYQLVQ